VHFSKQFGIAAIFRQRQDGIAVEDNGLEVFHPHCRATAQSSKMAIGVNIDARNGRTVFSRRADAEDGAVPGTFAHAPQDFACFVYVLPPEETALPDVDMGAAHFQKTRTWRSANKDQGLKASQTKRHGTAAAAVAFGVVIVVGRLEGANRLAHQRKITRERADGKK
jgi:hypothetical protein